MRFTRKSYLTVNFVLFFVILAVSFITTATIIHNGQQDTVRTKTQLLTEQVGKDLSNTLTGIDRTSRVLFLNEEFQDFTDGIYADDPEAIESINKHFDMFISLDQYLYKNVIYIPRDPSGEIDENNVLSSGTGYEYIQVNAEDIIGLSERPEYIGGKAFYKKIVSHFDGGDAPFFAVARNVYDMRSASYLQRMGIGIIFINSNKIGDAFEYAVALDGLDFCILGGDEIVATSSDFKVKSLRSDDYYRVNYDLDNFGWQLVGIYDESYINRSVWGSYVYLIAFTLVAGAAFVAVSTFVYRKSTESLEYLFRVFSDLKESSSIKPLKHGKDTDVNRIIDSFNGMLDSVAGLNDAVLEEKNRALLFELKNTEYQLISLHSQINKHFLINVLSLMRSFVNLGETEKIKSCIENLSEFLRYSLTINDNATVGQEIEMLGAYLNIQSLRYPNVRCELTCEENVKARGIPKMILQPIIENAYTHGLQKKKGSIKVACRARNGFIYFFVVDDGKGISKEKVREINGHLKNNEKIDSLTGSGVALSNIMQRLQLATGEKSFIRIKSVEGRGTVVVVGIYGGENV